MVTRFQMGTLLLLFCLCFAALLTPPMPSMAQADEDEIKPPPGPAEDLKTPEYFINIAPLPPGKPCNPSSHNQVVMFWFVVIICFLLWIFGRSVYRGWRRRKQQELVTTLSHSASVAFANSDGIPPPISELPTDNSPEIPSTDFNSPISELPTENSPVNSPISGLPTELPTENSPPVNSPISGLPTELPTENSPVNSPICELPTDNSPVMLSEDLYAIPRPLPSAPPIELLTCNKCGHEECDVYPSQFVCLYCGNVWPVYAV